MNALTLQLSPSAEPTPAFGVEHGARHGPIIVDEPKPTQPLQPTLELMVSRRRSNASLLKLLVMFQDAHELRQHFTTASYSGLRSSSAASPVKAGLSWARPVRPALFLTADTFYKPVVVEGDSPGYFERFMIPPRTYKAEYSFVASFIHNPRGEPRLFDSSTMFLLELLYRLALQAVATADRVVFNGFSMAPADTSIRMLFRAAADANTRLRLVEIADPEFSAESQVKSVLPNAHNYRKFSYFVELLDDWEA